MPTGYTACIEDGCTFNEFIMGCARGFGALVNMRDDAQDAEIPDEVKPGTYHPECIEKAEARLARVQKLTTGELETESLASYEQQVQQEATYQAEQEKHRELYAAMLTQVKAWEPPTKAHIRLKEFMAEQIEMSVPGVYHTNPPVLLSAEQWLASETSRLQDSLKYNRTEYDKEVVRCLERTQWIKHLRTSLTEE